jgi:cysteine-rich repeat protein
MSRRIANLAFAAALGLVVSVGLAGVAWAGPTNDCGNGVTEDPPEKCDDGNETTGDGCSFPSCLPEVCGDNIVNPDAPSSETCDDGNTDPGDGCSATCQLECGNGTLEGEETCDDSGESATCDDDCTAVQCGDGNVNETAGEDCEPPGSATCDENCQDATAPLDKAQQACVNGLNSNALGVVKAENKAIGKCLKDAAAGKTDIATCLGGLGAATQKAKDKTTKTDTTKCTEPKPGFAYTGATTVNTAAADGSLNSVVAVFGAAPVVADKKADKDGAACQAEVAKRHFKLQETLIAEGNKAKKTALKGSKTTPAVANGGALEAALNAALANNAKVAKAENGVNTGVDKKCPAASVDPLFDCAGAATPNELAVCVILQAKRGGCLALEQADDLDLTCPGDS